MAEFHPISLFGYKTWKRPVPTPADLPASGERGERRTVLDDGDGRPADYVWNHLTLSWEKIADPDVGGGPGVGSALLLWGNDSVGSTTTTRYLSPEGDDGTAQTSPIQYRAVRAGTLQKMRVRHNVPAGNGAAIVYTVRKNGVATTLTVSLASTASDGSDLVNTVAVAAGDLLDVIVTKAATVAVSPSDVVAVLEFV